MWGPVCVNPDHLAAVIGELAKVDAFARKVTALSRRRPAPNDPRVVKAKTDLDEARRIVANLFRKVTTCGQRFTKATKPGLVQSEMGFPFPELEVSGWPYNAFRETLADLQSTALAVHALRAAHEHGKLPEDFRYDDLKGLTGKALARPIRTSKVLAATLTRVLAARDPQAGWDETIAWARATEFGRIREDLKGPAEDLPRSVESAWMPICNAQAAAAIEDLCVLLGKQDDARCQEALADARRLAVADPNAGFALPTRLPKSRQRDLEHFRLCDPNTGGVIEPYDWILQLRLGPASTETKPARLAALAGAVEFLTARQGEDGQWPCADMLLPLSSPALREYYRYRVPQRVAAVEARRRQLDVKDRKPLTDWHGMIRLAPSRYWYMSREQAKLRATVFAVFALGRIVGNAPEIAEP